MRKKRTIRYRSQRTVWGHPLVVIALGPDAARGESRGYAKGIIAIGDFAVGVLALGGITAGVISIGGLACGLLTIGGVGIGALVLGGVAVGGIACGGVAVGLVAAGGVAIGYFYAAGKTAIGAHVINAVQRDPQAVEFFSHWLPGIRKDGG